MKRPLLYLGAEDVRRALPMAEAIATMRKAFVQLASGQVTLPPRQHVAAPGEEGVGLVMTCHSAALKLFSVKFITLFSQNRQKGLPTIQALVLLADGETGSPLGILDGAALTAIRTGAASGLATEVLARGQAEEAAVFGAGVQARAQLEAVCCVRAIRHAWVYDVNPAAADQFARAMNERLGLSVEPARTPAQALENADVVCTASTSSVPVFADADLKAGVHINAVGSYQPGVAEIPSATVCRARVVVDHRASALAEAGDLLQPLGQGLIRESHFQTDLGEVVLGRQPGRRNPEEVTLFKSVGVAVQDLCAAACALENARRLELGQVLK